MIFINLLRRAAVLCLLASTLALAQDAPQARLRTVTLNAGMHNIQAEVALTPEERSTGLMWRRQMAQHEGMLFVSEEPGLQCFWMRNTLLPLSIAFLADDGTIVNIADMKPRDEQSHCAQAPVRYALEMNQGWFAKRGLKAGDRLRGKPFEKR